MSVTPLRNPIDIERLPGCDDRCLRRRYLNEATQQLAWTLDHNPASHEGYGAAWVTHQRQQEMIRTGGLVVDQSRALACVGEQEIHLTPTEVRILVCLGSRIGTTVPYSTIMGEVFDDPRAENHAWHEPDGPGARWHLVRVHVTRIRTKLGAARSLLVTRPPIGLELLDVEQAP